MQTRVVCYSFEVDFLKILKTKCETEQLKLFCNNSLKHDRDHTVQHSKTRIRCGPTRPVYDLIIVTSHDKIELFNLSSNNPAALSQTFLLLFWLFPSLSLSFFHPPHPFTHSFTLLSPPSLPWCSLPPALPLCLDLLVCSVYFSLSVGVRFGTSGISSSLLSFNPAVLPEGIRRKPLGLSACWASHTQSHTQKIWQHWTSVFWPYGYAALNVRIYYIHICHKWHPGQCVDGIRQQTDMFYNTVNQLWIWNETLSWKCVRVNVLEYRAEVELWTVWVLLQGCLQVPNNRDLTWVYSV